jgi:hypothetical protein
MFFSVKVLYRTAGGQYQEQYCHLDHAEAGDFQKYLFVWMIEHVPEGSSIIKVNSGWSPLPPDEVFHRRIKILGATT